MAILQLLNFLVGFMPLIGTFYIAGFVVFIEWLGRLVLLVYVGRSMVKSYGGDLLQGAFAGGLAGLITSVVGTVLGIIGVIWLVVSGSMAGWAALLLPFILIGWGIGIVFWTVAGAVAGVFGALIATVMGKK